VKISPAAPSRAQATRSRLLEAGRRAFAAKGLDGTNLREDILEPAGVSVGSFYHQFQDKTELLFAILRDDAERFRARMSQAHTPVPGRALVDICRESYGMTLDMAELHEEGLRIQFRERNGTDPRVREFLREERSRWVESLARDYERIAAATGLVIDAALAAELMVALSFGMMASYLELPRTQRRRERTRVLEALCRFTMGGLLAAVTIEEPPPLAPRKRRSSA
jgi:AcrR family transcriptional regulator